MPPCEVPPASLGRILKEYTFEDGVGGPSTEGWVAVDSSGFGLYADLVSGASVVQEDPAYFNDGHFWSFYKNSPDDYGCGGYPSQLAVPKTTNPGSHSYSDYIHNEVASKWIPLADDKDGVPVPAEFDQLTLTFDAYMDLPLANLVFYVWKVRFMVAGVPTAWMDDGYAYYSAAKVWFRNNLAGFVVPIPGGATDVQVAVGVKDMAWTWGPGGACHSHAPLIDNVCVSRTVGHIYKVTSTADTNTSGTLRRAMLVHGSSPEAGAISFDIPGPGPHMITLLSALPVITHQLIIDGFTQPGASPNTNPVGEPLDAQIEVSLWGPFAGSPDGLVFQSPGVVRGLSTHGWAGAAIRVSSPGVVVEGSYIGMDASGITGNGNLTGVLIESDGCVVGGAAPASRNVIGWSVYGVRVDGADGVGIYGNYIGIGADASTSLGNDIGVMLLGGAQSNHIGSANPGEANVIAYGDYGVVVSDPYSVDNRIVGNSMHHIAAQGIDLGQDGITINDFLDFDFGANYLQNFPDVSAASGNQVSGIMHGGFSESITLNFYRSPQSFSSCNAEIYMGEIVVNTDGGGTASFTFTPAQPIPPANYIVATATNASGSTSELSFCILSENTPVGSSVLVDLVDANGNVRGSATYGDVSSPGNTFVVNPFTPPVPVSSNFTVGNPNDPSIYFDVTTDASYTGGVDVCLFYDENNIPGPEGNLVIAHYDGSAWVDVTTTRDLVNNVICGHVATLSPFVIATLTPTGIGAPPVPTSFALHPNVPNPFNPITTIAYDIPEGGADVNITIYDVAGRMVRELVDEHRSAGTWSVQWNGDDDRGQRVASGVYFYRMRAGEFNETRKMVLLK